MSKKTSATKMLTLVALSAFIVISTILGMVKIVIPAIISGYNAAANAIGDGVATTEMYFRIHPNMQIVGIIGIACGTAAILWVTANVFHVKWAKHLWTDLFE